MSAQPIGDPRDRLVSVEEYLSTPFEPDCEYQDGVIVERNLGEFEHSFLQAILATIFTNHMEAWGAFGLTEQRVRIGPQKFFVPDLCVLRFGAPAEDILTHPPLIVFEVMSPDDTIPRAANRAADYLQFGVEHVWVIDPGARVGYRGAASGLERIPGGEFTVPGTPISIRIPDLFEKLDRVRAAGSKR
jgi:Uma2 family endonuclease